MPQQVAISQTQARIASAADASRLQSHGTDADLQAEFWDQARTELVRFKPDFGLPAEAGRPDLLLTVLDGDYARHSRRRDRAAVSLRLLHVDAGVGTRLSARGGARIFRR